TKDARKDIGQMVQEIINGRIDWILIDKTVADQYIASYTQLTTFELQNQNFSDISYNAVALPLGSELTDEVNAAIATLKASGKIDELIAKWFTEEAE
ncbi:MAG: transporter substrate-binding domain-containing protein, partial [Erysipelotrichaceae bacterium]|nr:transporter substrate-binding domain-containing protein [Erysipelotrichaceae bacterium]